MTHKGNESIQTVACTTNSNLLTPLKIKFLANNASCSSTLTTEITNNEPPVKIKLLYPCDKSKTNDDTEIPGDNVTDTHNENNDITDASLSERSIA